ncbi:MAG: hypothetical protein RUMPE_00348 [Eubacteriales bacterium SKADARSKE-1]|nr:hypothetical protein [Eubacteriales bacterium SKADARSKE-1]
MKKQTQNIIMACIILGLLLGVFFLVVSIPPSKEPNTSSSETVNTISPFLENTSYNISSVVVENNSEEFAIEVLNQDGKRVYNIDNSDPNKTPSQSILQTFMGELINISSIQIVENDTTDLKKYGLEDESAKITVNFADGTNKVFKLGNEAPLSIGYYLRINDENTVYLISKSNAEIFLNNKEFYFEDIKK